MIWVAGRSPTLVSQNLKATTLTYLAIVAAYRWAIEVLWKFLKMHLKLDKMISKSLHGIAMKIDPILIVYLLLQLYAYGTVMPMEIPRIYGSK